MINKIKIFNKINRILNIYYKINYILYNIENRIINI